MQNRDGQTIDSLIAALYETISGPAGPRDWQRERGLFAKGAILLPAGPIPGTGAARSPAEILDVEGYIASRAPYFASNDLYEAEIARQTFRFGNTAHVLSAYAVRRRPDDAKPAWRGVNSIQLLHDGARWRIASIVWDNERPENPLPEWADRAR